MNDTAFLFCSNYFDRSRPDDEYAAEFDQASKLRRKALLFNLDAFLADGSVDLAPAERPTTLVYRGWMLGCRQYASLYRILGERGYSLINSPEQYRNCHHLPSWYGMLRDCTAESIWTDGAPDEEEVKKLLARMGGRPLIVKDYVKSRKHEWAEACFIPDASDTERAARVVRTFIERQDTDLAGGVVLREFLPLRLTGAHPQSGMPTAWEVRVFCFRHTPFAAIRYWSGEEENSGEEYRALVERCRDLDSNFYTVDLAQQANGEWVVMEVGDGQVSGLQDYDPALFHDALSVLLRRVTSSSVPSFPLPFPS